MPNDTAANHDTPRGGFYRAGTPGSPDVVCVIEGKFVGLEIKSQDGELNPNQEEFRRRLIQAGGSYHVVRALDDVIAAGL